MIICKFFKELTRYWIESTPCLYIFPVFKVLCIASNNLISLLCKDILKIGLTCQPVKFLPCLYIEREKQPSPSTNPVR